MYGNQDQNKTFCIEIVPPTMPFENMLSSDNFYFLCNSIELSQYICKARYYLHLLGKAEKT